MMYVFRRSPIHIDNYYNSEETLSEEMYDYLYPEKRKK